MWLGTGQRNFLGVQTHPRRTGLIAAVVLVAYLAIRYTPLWHTLRTGTIYQLVNKWHLGPLRLRDFGALATFFAALAAVNTGMHASSVQANVLTAEILCLYAVARFVTRKKLNTHERARCGLKLSPAAAHLLRNTA